MLRDTGSDLFIEWSAATKLQQANSLFEELTYTSKPAGFNSEAFYKDEDKTKYKTQWINSQLRQSHTCPTDTIMIIIKAAQAGLLIDTTEEFALLFRNDKLPGDLLLWATWSIVSL